MNLYISTHVLYYCININSNARTERWYASAAVPDSQCGEKLSLSHQSIIVASLLARHLECDSASHDPPTLAYTIRCSPLSRDSPFLLGTEQLVTHSIGRALECLCTSRQMRCSGNLALCRFALLFAEEGRSESLAR